MNQTTIVVPARYDSTRLPGKPLADIGGMPMIVRVLKQLSAVEGSALVAAVDDARVAEAVELAGYTAVMTAKDHESGSDRVMEVAAKLDLPNDDVVINVQGDEPLVPAAVVRQIATFMRGHPSSEMATLCEPLLEETLFSNPNVVKVARRLDGKALYFSRAEIPFPRDQDTDRHRSASRHIGIYAFKVRSLRAFTDLAPSPLERLERLEQLRWLDNGGQIDVLDACEPVPGGVDTPEDLARIREAFA